MALKVTISAPFRFVNDDPFDALRAGGALHVVMQVTRFEEEDGEEEEQEEAGEEEDAQPLNLGGLA